MTCNCCDFGGGGGGVFFSHSPHRVARRQGFMGWQAGDRKVWAITGAKTLILARYPLQVPVTAGATVTPSVCCWLSKFGASSQNQSLCSLIKLLVQLSEWHCPRFDEELNECVVWSKYSSWLNYQSRDDGCNRGKVVEAPNIYSKDNAGKRQCALRHI